MGYYANASGSATIINGKRAELEESSTPKESDGVTVYKNLNPDTPVSIWSDKLRVDPLWEVYGKKYVNANRLYLWLS